MENKTICSKCKGKCCKQMGCHLSPSDIIKMKGKITEKKLIELFKTGNYSIDWWEGFILNEKYVNGYYIRMRNKKSPIVDPSWGGECVLLTKKGCPLQYKDRPKGGKLLIPNINYECGENYSKFECAQEWSEYYNILNYLQKIFTKGEF